MTKEDVKVNLNILRNIFKLNKDISSEDIKFMDDVLEEAIGFINRQSNNIEFLDRAFSGCTKETVNLSREAEYYRYHLEKVIGWEEMRKLEVK